ncbi:MAG: tRNA (N(6)-L-threonylcarbamoyladenosine(37)-C(2))-methylthiotransferase MtaB [Clostridia bacterium]|nr:tRNA (N(6)-L-threonylcarbamoyladenosine(37)-C(2))-methylthiotransferase MtaB [Clostridia bacterium]
MSFITEKSVGFCTLGCRVNQYESDALSNEFFLRGWDVRDFSQRCSVYVINICTVTAESDRKSAQMIRRARTANPDAFVAVCGCFSQIRPQEAAKYADYVCGTRNKLSVIDAAEKFINGQTPGRICVTDASEAGYEPLFAPHTQRTRAFVKIEDGCDGRCAYCLIKTARGRVVSRGEDDILAELQTLYDAGYPEAVLTGIETSAYGRDTGTDLVSLLLKTNGVKCPPRIRLGSLDPAYLTPEVSKRLSEVERLMPHLHLSVQSGSSAVLSAMRRKYNADTLYRNVSALRESIPGIRFSADLIAGFPGETEEDHEKTLGFLDFANLVHAHIFPFSERAGTEAAAMAGRLDKKVKTERAASLAKRQARINEEDAKNLCGRTVSVLFETSEGGVSYGHSEHFLYVRVKTGLLLHGEVRDVTLLSYSDGVFDASLQ